MPDFEMGSEAQDIVSEQRGIITQKCVYLNGCVQYFIKPQGLNKDGKTIDGLWVDSEQLVSVGEGITKNPLWRRLTPVRKLPRRATGGPTMDDERPPIL